MVSNTVGRLLRRCRLAAGLTQRQAADRVQTSAPTWSQYENGRKAPRLSTLDRMVAELGFDLRIDAAPAHSSPRPLDRTEARSIALHERIATRLLDEPDRVLAAGRANLDGLRQVHSDASADRHLDRWQRLLDGEPRDLVLAMLDPSDDGRDLRQNTVFAGVLAPEERWSVYREFAA